MHTEIKSNPRYPITERAQRMQDVMLVTTFTVWAALIGFVPVMTYRILVN